MKRTQIYLSEKELKLIKEHAAKSGLSKSEVVRRIIDYYFEKKEILDND